MTRRFSMLSAAGWSLSWAVGVALGVALGAYLTVTGAAAAPGDVRPDATELFVLPGIAAAVTFAVSFILRFLFARFSGLLATSPSREEAAENQHDDDDEVSRR